ncbi:hypothetical protein EE612_040113 [Oryza sativa]|nr:hypothetical protein EE612_040113 [Oryza sativa]
MIHGAHRFQYIHSGSDQSMQMPCADAHRCQSFSGEQIEQQTPRSLKIHFHRHPPGITMDK